MTTEDVGAPESPAVTPVADGSATPTTSEQKTGRIARLMAEKEKLTTRALDTRDKLNDRRSSSETINTVFSVIERDTITGGPVLAGAVAFRVFLFQIPYVFTLVAAFGTASDAAGEDPNTVARKAGIGGLTAQAMSDIGHLSAWGRVGAVLAGAFALFLAARAAVKVFFIIHALVWGVPMRKPKSSTKAALVFIGLVTTSLFLAGFVGWLHQRSMIGGLVGIVLFVVVPTGTWLLVSWFLPHPPECTWTSLLPGAIFFGIGVEALHVFTVYWIAHEISTKSDRYGAIGTALALLFWAYILGRLIVAAATLNAARWRIEHHQRPHIPIEALEAGADDGVAAD
jgi:uncharacterized BrkB/YihY/UPF0761 family membrane protein